jgi:transposase
MSQGKFGKSINDASWTTLTKMIAYKAENAGRQVIFVDPRGASQECSGCGQMVKKALSERTHSCPCGLVLDRDLNAAINILMRSRGGKPRRREDPDVRDPQRPEKSDGGHS